MFNNRIAIADSHVRRLTFTCESVQASLWELREQVEAIKEFLGVKIEKIPAVQSKVVAVPIKKEEGTHD